MSGATTLYPGVDADDQIAAAKLMIGEITSFWAQVEDALFELFVVSLTGHFGRAGDLRPYRAVFFAGNSYELKVRMINAAFLVRYAEQSAANKSIISAGGSLKKDLDAAAKFRNKMAHLVPMTIGTPDPNARANVRFLPPFWKGAAMSVDIKMEGYSISEVCDLFSGFSGFDPRCPWPTFRARPTLFEQLRRLASELSPIPENEAPSSSPCA